MRRILPDLTAEPMNVVRLRVEPPIARRSRFDAGEIVSLYTSGLSVKQVAKNLGCSEPTVRYHLQKADCPTRRYTRRSKPRSETRHEAHTVKDKPAGLLRMNHPALTECRTIYPSTVVRPDSHERCLISGVNNRKIGGTVIKGPLKGMPIYTLTLEERSTCPKSCQHWRSCYGNNMHLARRFEAGADLESWLPIEIAMLLRSNPSGILIRLHVLGDFYSVDYVNLWQQLLERFPKLHVFGFTARTDPSDPICPALARLVDAHWPRFAIRFSNRTDVDPSTISIEHPFQKPDDAVICPAQTGKTENCGTCGLCWHSSKRIAFLQH